MNKHVLYGIALAGVAALSAGSASAQVVTCGEDYIIARGDTLSKIAGAAYGDRLSYQLIYNANADAIGPNPGIIEVGTRLSIPCLDEPIEPSTASATPIRQVETTALLEAPKARQIRIVTATDWAPFLNQDQAQGGMITEVVNVALSKVTQEGDFKIDWVNDWSAHIQPLISDVAYDFSLAWFRPNCDVVEKLGEGSQFRCNNLDWSDALYQQIIGYYTMSTFPSPASHEDLLGKTLCRPAGYATFMMEEHDLVEPNANIVRAAGPTECFEGLIDGTYDVVVLAEDVAEGTIAELGAIDAVVKHDQLDAVATMHAVTSKNNPEGAAQLAILNDGISQIKESGEWFSIVRRHLAEHRAAQ